MALEDRIEAYDTEPAGDGPAPIADPMQPTVEDEMKLIFAL